MYTVTSPKKSRLKRVFILTAELFELEFCAVPGEQVWGVRAAAQMFRCGGARQGLAASSDDVSSDVL